MEPTQNNPNNHNLIIIQRLEEFKNDIINIIDNKNNKLNVKIKNFTYKINNQIKDINNRLDQIENKNLKNQNINNNKNNKRLAKYQINYHSKLIEDNNENDNIKIAKNLYYKSPEKYIKLKLVIQMKTLIKLQKKKK